MNLFNLVQQMQMITFFIYIFNQAKMELSGNDNNSSDDFLQIICDCGVLMELNSPSVLYWNA